MALSITLNVTDADEIILNRITVNYNTAAQSIGGEQLTPTQLVRQTIRDWFLAHKSRFVEEDRASLREAYQAATPEVQAQIDVLLEPYR